MGIDGIGKGPGVRPPISPAGGAGGASGPTGPGGAKGVEPSKAFHVDTGRVETARVDMGKTEVSNVEGVKPSALDRVKSGEIGVGEYLDHKVEEATAHLKALPAADLSAIKKTLRDQLVSDPALADLVHQATGRAPQPSDEE